MKDHSGKGVGVNPVVRPARLSEIIGKQTWRRMDTAVMDWICPWRDRQRYNAGLRPKPKRTVHKCVWSPPVADRTAVTPDAFEPDSEWRAELRERTWSMEDGMDWRVMLDELAALIHAINGVIQNAQTVPNSETVIVNARLLDALERARDEPALYLDALKPRAPL